MRRRSFPVGTRATVGGGDGLGLLLLSQRHLPTDRVRSLLRRVEHGSVRWYAEIDRIVDCGVGGAGGQQCEPEATRW